MAAALSHLWPYITFHYDAPTFQHRKLLNIGHASLLGLLILSGVCTCNPTVTSIITIFRQLTAMSVRCTKCLMLILLQDAQRVPAVFFPFGAIPAAELGDWLRKNALALPPDLVELWQLTGGGDIFESETIFRPTVPSVPNACFVEDDIEGGNTAHTARGKPSDLYLFQQGVFLSAVRLSDQKFVTLTDNYSVEHSFDSIDEWYVRTLRVEFGERYGLSPVKT